MSTVACSFCFTSETPQWRAGPEGVVLCNACGVRFTRKKTSSRPPSRPPSRSSSRSSSRCENATIRDRDVATPDANERPKNDSSKTDTGTTDTDSGTVVDITKGTENKTTVDFENLGNLGNLGDLGNPEKLGDFEKLDDFWDFGDLGDLDDLGNPDVEKTKEKMIPLREETMSDDSAFDELVPVPSTFPDPVEDRRDDDRDSDDDLGDDHDLRARYRTLKRAHDTFLVESLTRSVDQKTKNAKRRRLLRARREENDELIVSLAAMCARLEEAEAKIARLERVKAEFFR